jgi:hypothetical protein
MVALYMVMLAGDLGRGMQCGYRTGVCIQDATVMDGTGG